MAEFDLTKRLTERLASGEADYRCSECNHYKQCGDEHMCDCGSTECAAATIEKLCLLEEKLEKGELWEPSLELCRSLAGTQIILTFAGNSDPLEPNTIEWRKRINGELYGKSATVMERNILLVLPKTLDFICEQIGHIEREVIAHEK